MTSSENEQIQEINASLPAVRILSSWNILLQVTGLAWVGSTVLFVKELVPFREEMPPGGPVPGLCNHKDTF